MPENDLLQPRRRVELDPEGIAAPARAPFVELGTASCFSFLRGASDAVDLVLTARALGYDALGIADANSLAGVVRLHAEAKTLRRRLAHGGGAARGTGIMNTRSSLRGAQRRSNPEA